MLPTRVGLRCASRRLSLLGLLAGALVAFGAGCSSSPSGGGGAESCERSSDCEDETDRCVDGRCMNECGDDRDCAGGMVCEDGACAVDVRACRADRDCQFDESCVQGLCETIEDYCEENRDCRNGSRCDVEARRCFEGDGLGCTPACGAGEICRDSACVEDGGDNNGDPPECVGDVDCEAGELCVEGACEPECAEDRDCEAGMACEAGACVAAPNNSTNNNNTGTNNNNNNNDPPECFDDGDCEVGEICQADMCVVGCRTTVDCGADEVCGPDARCIEDPNAPECREDRDCAGDMICEVGVCVEPDPPNNNMGDPGAYWDTCAAASECQTGLCLGNPQEGGGRCTSQCSERASCAQAPVSSFCIQTYHLVGQGGSGLAGLCFEDDTGSACDPTATPNPCIDGLCIHRAISMVEGQCTIRCRSAADCDPGLACGPKEFGVGGDATLIDVCVPIGEVCAGVGAAAADQCFSSFCVTDESDVGLCTTLCDTAAACPAGYACTPAGEASVCLPL